MSDKKALYYIDFDKLFENYADKYYSEHESEYHCPDDFAADLDKVYHEWATSPQAAIGGISPSDFFSKIPTDELLDILKGACAGENNPSSLLFDRVASEPSLTDGLCTLARSARDEKLLSVVLGALAELGTASDEFYLEMLDGGLPSGAQEQCIEALCERAESVKDRVLDMADGTDDVGVLEMYAEILTNCLPGNGRIVALLTQLLHTDPNTAYIAGLIGRYGDEAAAPALYPFLDDCDYATFIELRNAIEELGGTVDDHYRDFSDDPLYQAIKGKK